MLKLKDQIFGSKGYSADMKLSIAELEVFRDLISSQWVSVIRNAYPDLADEAAAQGIENYHIIADRLDHKSLWPKANRVFSQTIVEKIKTLQFFQVLKQEFGEFSISDVYDVKQRYGHEEIYWRLVRPNVKGDVGLLHADKWFHDSFNMGYGMFPEGSVTVKVWIPIFCEPGKSGLSMLEGSHLNDWKYHIEEIEGLPKPVIDENADILGAELILTEPGNMLIFHEKTLHGGVLNEGRYTRVSVEITMVMPDVPISEVK
jgi:ectoine hydroxylase-related dioxygenase (phytanoyl-CoA dioxygenase family)